MMNQISVTAFSSGRLLTLLRKLMTPKDKIKLCTLALLMVVNAGLEIIGIGILLPLTAFVITTDNNHYFKFTKNFADFFRGHSQKTMLVIFCLLIILIWLGKSLLSIWSIILERHFTDHQENTWSDRVYRTIMTSSYQDYLLKNNTATLCLITERVRNVCDDILMPLILTIADGVTIFCLTVALCWIMPKIVIGSALFLTATGLLVYYPLRHLNYCWGEMRNAGEQQLNQLRHESFDAIKSIKCFHKEDFFQKKHAILHKKALDYRSKLFILGQLPRHIMEFSAIILALSIFAIMVLNKIPGEKIILLFGFLIATLSRLLPAASRLYYNLSKLRQCEFALNEVAAALQTPMEKITNFTKSTMNLTQSIEFCNVNYAYPGKKNAVLQNFNCSIRANETTAIIGPSGSGKTTIIDLLLGLLIPDCGTIKVDNTDIHSDIYSWRRCIGYVPQNHAPINGTIMENVAFGVPQEQIDAAGVTNALRTAQLLEVIEKQPDGINTVIGSGRPALSGGQLQRLMIARALYFNPALLILDEATNALDQSTALAFIDALESMHHKITIIIIAHHPEILKYCDNIINLDSKC